MPTVALAEWRPDVAVLNSAYASDVRNVLCGAASYLPFPSLSLFTNALAARPLGYILARSLAGQISIFAGTATKLYKLNNTTLAWDDVSRPATTYSASVDAQWSFAQFGDFVIAVNPNNDPQVYELGVSATFDNLAGSPPRAAVVKVWGDFVALMRLTSNPERVQWSGLNDAEFWTPGSNNSDYQDFPDGGVVQGSTEATNPLIFQEKAIRMGVFVPGSVEVFTFAKIHDLRGAKSASSIASRGSLAFYADEGGFFQIGADGQIVPIGFEKVDKTIFGTMAASDIAEIRGVIDPFYSRVYWALDTGGTGYFNTMLIYDWQLEKWTQASATIVLHAQAATTGYTLEGLDALFASLETMTLSLDSKTWQGGAPLLGAFDTSFRFGFFNGSNSEATLITQEMGDETGTVTTTRSMFPVVDTASVYVSVGSRLRRSDSYLWTAEGLPSSAHGRVLKMSRGRFHKFKARIPAGTSWTHAQSVDVDLVPTGRR